VVLAPDAGELADVLPPRAAPAGVSVRLPVVAYADGPAAGDGHLRRLGDACTVLRAAAPDAVLDLVTLALHRPLAKLPEDQRQRLLDRDRTDRTLAGRKVLIVDDDMRNIFALSAVLEEHDMHIVSADNGRDAIRTLQADPSIDIVLMDIMMPEMDGMETMREIRKVPNLKSLPIVAVTAKAMKGDREKCIEAGAWDYLSKPVDPEQLFAVLRAWLHR
jgi:CheY-like chemotaxis protein